MEATHHNVKAVYEALREMNVPAIMLSTLGKSDEGFFPFTLTNFVNLYEFQKEMIYLIAGGTGFPGFSTDTAAAIFAYSYNMDKIIKSTNAGAIYNRDPREVNSSVELERIPYISYRDAIKRDLRVMDLTAIAYCEKNSIDIHVTGVEDADTLESILKYNENPGGSLVTSEEKVLKLTRK